MNPTHLRSITNAFQDVRLISLAALPVAAAFPERDGAGPYLVAQEGYDPGDPSVKADEFLLSRSGGWMSVARFLALPKDSRRDGFFFSTSAEVIRCLEQLPPVPTVMSPAGGGAETAGAGGDGNADGDGLAQAIRAGRPG